LPMSDEWATSDAFNRLTPKVLAQIREWFKGYSRDEKIHCLLAIALAKDDNLARSAKTMQGIIEQAETDPDQWVQGLARLLLGFPFTSTIQCSQTDKEFVYKLSEAVKLHVVPHALLSQAAELVTALPQALAPVDSPASPALSPRSAPKEPDFVATKDPEELFAWLAEDMKEQ
ncbi:unnamed protein product, partial [Polarella glacialis]